MVKLHIRPNAYYDSVTLMLISKDLKKVEGIKEALVGMGTDLNKEISRNIGLSSPELEQLTGNDFFIAIECDAEEALEKAIEKTEELLNKKKSAAAADYYYPNVKSAVRQVPGLNMAIISVPGQYAHEVAQECLDNNINVIMFSDNVSLEDEKALKEYAVSKELLMMGPDCGTAIVNGVPLAFANVVRRGGIGIVAASGTGTQEVSTIIDQLGGGVSQVLGTGGRDLRKEIGGLMYSLSLDALIKDSTTKVIVMISKPPSKEIQTKILEQAKASGKPVVVCFIGGDNQEIEDFGLIAAVSLEDAAHKAVAAEKRQPIPNFTGFSMGDAQADTLASEIVKTLGKEQKYIRGLYTGGTLCDEAMKLSACEGGKVFSNIPLSEDSRIPDKNVSQEHTFLDFGDDAFTKGRPHPMIDPSLRAERVVKEAQDPTTAVILLDCVIGYGAHEDPATDLADAIKMAKKEAADQGRGLAVVVSVCGTEADPQCLSKSRKTLEEAGAVVLPSNAQAIRFADKIIHMALSR